MGVPFGIVPLLITKENYESWKIRTKSYLLGEELWDIVEGTEPKPDEATQVAEFRTWRKKNGKALHAIQLSCGLEVFDIISEMDSAKDAWDKIILNFKDSQPLIEESESSNLLNPGRSSDDNAWRLHLYKTVVKGDWETIKNSIKSHPEALREKLSRGETILHTALIHNHVHIVMELVKLMSPEDLELRLSYRRDTTALHLAAMGGNVDIAKVLVERNKKLPGLVDLDDDLPVHRASLVRNLDMVYYLYSVTPEERINTGFGGADLLINMIAAEDYDFALKMQQQHPMLTLAQNSNNYTPLQALSDKPSAFPSGNQLKYWQRWIINCINVELDHADNNESILQKKGAAHWLKELASDAVKFLAPGLIKQIYSMKLKNKQALALLKSMSEQVSTLIDSEIEGSPVVDALVSAAQFGVVEFIVEMVKSNPALLWVSARSRCIFHVAVTYRQERVWNLIHGLGAQGVELASFVQYSDQENLLHKAGRLAPSKQLKKIPGPAMQMQRELQWFKELESIVPPRVRENLNMECESAPFLFTERHRELMKEAEVWMKDTATSCMVVTTLIATVMFAAAFTVPGGFDDQTGNPMFLGQKSFMVFIVADALSLFSSTTSLLMFLSILTSRYAEEDFLKSLPKRLIIGFATLFFSIATMMVTFSATLVIVLNDQYKWVAIPVSLLASFPVTLFALLQFPLLVDMVLSTYGPSIFQRQTKSLFNSIPTQSTQVQYFGP